eukprot:CAMPEP_0171464914 /NCGR_PEP_ID=MMETSP0945-20130129/8100_1 /TAXON_ID=109269 /ORGANISM="Vaucheria litorea, Strain CCMP2940" /LENGTH=134 /DNA_ID=CAMNT_0011992213 /DNA_START=453 /DNA_END=854 /DNA_ORIENTATION=-
MDRVLSTLLTGMDGALGTSEESKKVIIIAATNNIHQLDPAILRPGRLETHIYMGDKKTAERGEIFCKKLQKLPLENDVDVHALSECLANDSEGLSVAEIVGVCEQAAMIALREDLSACKMKKIHFEKAMGMKLN